MWEFIKGALVMIAIIDKYITFIVTLRSLFKRRKSPRKRPPIINCSQ
jgi:hypothetical protein